MRRAIVTALIMLWAGTAAPATTDMCALVLNSYHPGIAWSDNEVRGICDTLAESGCTAAVVYLDSKHFPDGAHLPQLAGYLQVKYRGFTFPVVIAADNPALSFALTWRARLFPDAAIVFCGINDYRPALIDGNPRVTGIAQQFDIAGTLTLIRQLHPALTELVVLHDTTVSGLASRRELEHYLARHPQDFPVTVVPDAPLPQLQHHLAALQHGQVVLLLSYAASYSRAITDHARLGALLAAASSQPVYGLHQELLGTGIVGGSLLSGYQPGRQAAEIARRIMTGVAPRHIPVRAAGPATLMIDWQPFTRFGLDAGALPARTRISNRPVPPIKKYLRLFIGTLIAATLLAVAVLFQLLAIRREQQARRQLAESENRYHILVESMAEGVILQRRDLTIIAYNSAAERTLGVAADQVLGRSSLEVSWDTIDETGAPLPAERHPSIITLQTGKPASNVVMGIRQAGTAVRWLSINTRPLYRQPDPQPHAVVISFSDISEQKQIVDELAFRVQLEAACSRLSASFVSSGDLNGKINRALQTIGETLRVDRAYLFQVRGGSDRIDNTHEWCASGIAPQLPDLQDIGATTTTPWLWAELCAGRAVPIDNVAAMDAVAHQEQALFTRLQLQALLMIPIMVDQRLLGYLGFDMVRAPRAWSDDDVSLLRLAAETIGRALDRTRVETAHARLIAAVEQAHEIIALQDIDGRIQYINSAVTGLTGYLPGEVIGRNVFASPRVEHAQQEAWESVRNGSTWHSVTTMYAKNGRPYELDMTIAPVRDDEGAITGVVSISRDVTRERLLEEQLRHAQKMESLGTLAGGIAHDFNNILASILGFAEILQDELPAESPLQETTSHILKAGNRAADLVRQILAFSRKTSQESGPLLPAPIIKEAAKLLRATLPSTIDIQLRIVTPQIMVTADPTQLHQLLMNLCTNAAHAMMKKGGELQIELRRECLTSDDLVDNTEIAPGSYARLLIRDTGTGIDPAIIGRIFDPFFTTKDVGKGTGMGLAVAHGIVTACGGTIRVHSTVGSGSTFEVLLPEVSGPAAESAPDAPSLPGGTERLLVVDDEQSLTIALEALLTRLGYRVTVAHSGPAALDAFSRDPGAFDLILTDQTMPGMTGMDLYREITRIRPDTPVILCTGYSQTAPPELAAARGIAAYLMKPVPKTELAATIRNVLDRVASER